MATGELQAAEADLAEQLQRVHEALQADRGNLELVQVTCVKLCLSLACFSTAACQDSEPAEPSLDALPHRVMPRSQIVRS
jgi:hypothetical protein